MPKIKGLNLKDSGGSFEVSQTIDLEEITGVDLSDETALKERIATAIIETIQSRTEKGESVFGGTLGNYSESYKKSLDFIAAGKSNPVNLYLSGDMINSMDLLEDDGSTLKIGFRDELENAKAYGHMTGMKGNPNLEGKVKKRVFFGVTQSDLKNNILRAFKSELIAVEAGKRVIEASKAQLDLLKKLREMIEVEEDNQNGD